MKKYTKSQRHLNYIRRRAKRSQAARLRFKRYRRQKNREEAGHPRQVTQAVRSLEHHPARHVSVHAPPVLSFVRNPEEVAKFTSRLTDLFNRRTPALVLLRNVKEVDYDGITVLLSVVVQFKAQNIPFNGDFPSAPEPKRIIKESGFIDHINDTLIRDTDSYELASKSLIYTHAKKNVDSILGEKIIRAASETVWGQKRRCPGLQRALIELMLNTNNHASPEGEEGKHWWLSVKHIKEHHRVRFSFVDYGVGVFRSLQNKPAESKFAGVLSRLYEKFRYGNNADVLKLIFEGELHRTATGKPFRGKGLPGIFEAVRLKKISSFAMITNNVFFSADDDQYRLLNNEFHGTFITWELTPDNPSFPYEN